MKWSEMDFKEKFDAIQKKVIEVAIQEKLIEEATELEFLLDGENCGIYRSIWECYNEDLLMVIYDTEKEILRIQKYNYEWLMPCVLKDREGEM